MITPFSVTPLACSLGDVFVSLPATDAILGDFVKYENNVAIVELG